MIRNVLLPALFLFVLLGCAKSINDNKVIPLTEVDSKISARVIYGEDNRLDLYEVTDPRLYDMARSTAVLVYDDQLTQVGNKYNIASQVFKDEFNLCSTEKFANQYSAGFCSGFLVDKNILVTAGHCLRNDYNCERTSFVFDYAVTSAGDAGPTSVDKNNVYKCKKLLRSAIQSNGADYAVVELDRNVTDRTPLNMRKSGAVSTGEPLVVIGYPSGIPAKVAAGANVRSQASGYFVANLDTYGGNSGSAVFNANTGLVEGILVRGETDFVYKNGCRVSNVCTDDGCRGEDVTHITAAFPSSKKNLFKRLFGKKSN